MSSARPEHHEERRDRAEVHHVRTDADDVSMILESSERITRTASARGGAGTPSSFSTASAQPCPFMNDEQ